MNIWYEFEEDLFKSLLCRGTPQMPPKGATVICVLQVLLIGGDKILGSGPWPNEHLV